MRAGGYLDATVAPTAGVELGLGIRFAEQRLGKRHCKGALADARRTHKQERARQPSSAQAAAKSLDNFIVSGDTVPHRRSFLPADSNHDAQAIASAGACQTR